MSFLKIREKCYFVKFAKQSSLFSVQTKSSIFFQINRVQSSSITSKYINLLLREKERKKERKTERQTDRQKVNEL
jgi:hypothetical protein